MIKSDEIVALECLGDLLAYHDFSTFLRKEQGCAASDTLCNHTFINIVLHPENEIPHLAAT